MDETSPKPASPRGLVLVEQDICLRRVPDTAGSGVVAEVECARRGCTVHVEQCARCPHFVRIETHEAGYLLLCRGHEQPAHDGEREPEVDPEP